MGDTVPHFRQITASRVGDVFTIDGQRFRQGTATQQANNCLIHTLSQQLCLPNIDFQVVRQRLREDFPAGPNVVTESNFLDLEAHWRHVLRHVADAGNVEIDPANFRIVCVDAMFPEHGDVVGDGAITLHITRQGLNHFVPLLQLQP